MFSYLIFFIFMLTLSSELHVRSGVEPKNGERNLHRSPKRRNRNDRRRHPGNQTCDHKSEPRETLVLLHLIYSDHSDHSLRAILGGHQQDNPISRKGPFDGIECFHFNEICLPVGPLVPRKINTP